MLYLDLSAVEKSLEVGKSVSFKVNCDDKSLLSVKGGFCVNVQADHSDYENIAFHFNPRAPTSRVVLNTRTDKKWQTEIYIKDKNVKSEYFDHPFDLKIEVKTKNHILISVNGDLKTGYDCKDDITKMKYLCYSSGVSIALDE
ncbi:uncharacterized protein [Mytilus edulis]|uniref:uncharacterized protein n=1 Tax=Mytilus edulis TaxID=6550 RepID=UPI0039F0D83F